MENKVDIIKKQLTGDFEKDISLLQSLFDECNSVIEDSNTTIEAISIVLDEIKNAGKEVETKEEQSDEISQMIDSMLKNYENGETDIALDEIDSIITQIESLTKDNEGKIYCSFKSEYEKVLFSDIFADEKEVSSTPYSNDTIYRIYASLLLKKNRKNEALKALDRAIYWNFLNREARKDKLDIFFSRKEYVKYIDTIRSMQNISYTPEDIADCYNEFGYIFKQLNDLKSSYAMYRISYTFFEDENVMKIINSFEEAEDSLKEMSEDQIIELAVKNEVSIGANKKIIDAQRKIVVNLINNNMYEEAKIMLTNDYMLTLNDETAELYQKIVELQEIENEKQEMEPQKKEVKKKTSTTKKKGATTSNKKDGSKSQSKNKSAVKKTTKNKETKK